MVLASFTPQTDADELIGVVGPLWVVPYHPNIFEKEVDVMYKDCFIPVVHRICAYEG